MAAVKPAVSAPIIASNSGDVKSGLAVFSAANNSLALALMLLSSSGVPPLCAAASAGVAFVGSSAGGFVTASSGGVVTASAGGFVTASAGAGVASGPAGAGVASGPAGAAGCPCPVVSAAGCPVVSAGVAAGAASGDFAAVVSAGVAPGVDPFKKVSHKVLNAARFPSISPGDEDGVTDTVPSAPIFNVGIPPNASVTVVMVVTPPFIMLCLFLVCLARCFIQCFFVPPP